MQPSQSLLELITAEAKRCAAKIQDSGGRNPLLYRRGARLDLDVFDEAVAAQFLAGREVHLVSNLLDEAQTSVTRRLLQRLLKRSKFLAEEQGLDVLSVAFGLVRLKKTGTESSDLEAPLVLLPASLRYDAGSDDYRLALSGDPSINFSLVRFLERERDIFLRDAVERLVDAQEGEGLVRLRDGFIELLRDAGLDPAVELDYRSLSVFTFAQEALVQDLEEDVEYLAQSDLVAALAGDTAAESRINDVLDPIGNAELDDLDFVDEPLALPADSSQRIEIAVALRGDHSVIEGPPGTGKSQTIANLIVALAARGKTALFVAEKRAALEAVQRRLEALGLGHLIMDLHRGKDQKKAAYRQIRETWAQVDPASRRGPAFLPSSVTSPPVLSERNQVRDRLNTRARVMSEEAAPGVPFGSLLSQGAGVPKAALGELRIPELSVATVSEVSDHLAEAASALFYAAGLELVLGKHPFRGLDSGGDTRQLRTALEEARAGLASLMDEVGSQLRDTADVLQAPLDVVSRASAFGALNFDEILRLADRMRSMPQLGWPAPGRWLALVSKNHRVLWREMRQSGPGVAASSLYRMSLEAAQWLGEWRRLEVLKDLDPQSVASSDIPEAAATFIEARDSIFKAFGSESLPPLLGSLDDANAWLRAALDAADSLPSVAGAIDRLRDFRRAGMWGALAFFPEVRDASSARSVIGRLLSAKSLEELRQSGGWPEALNWPGDRLADLRQAFCELDAAVEENAGALALWASNQRAVSALEAARERRIRLPNRSQKGYIEITPYALLQREAGKQQAHISLRTLLRVTGDAAISLRPCWAMSPITASQLLPRKQLFDVVIFDEASQVEAAVALPSIARGRQVIVAGDSMQLPPSAYFSRLWMPDEEDGDWTEPPDDVEEKPAALDGGAESADPGVDPVLAIGSAASPPPAAGLSVLLSSESILQAVSLKLRRVGSLKWHYRSRDERLIAFSNAYIYKPLNRALLTFPAPTIESPVSLVQVPAKPGESRTAGASSRDVGALIDATVQAVRGNPDGSVGVITFNVNIVELFESALKERLRMAEKDDANLLTSLFDDETLEPFFCKSIEQVQGDERDTIILHVPAYFTKSAKLKAWFGKINQLGGERRLNVATTRARRRMIVVSAVSPEQLASMQFAPGSGPDFLRSFLTYADRGGQLEAAVVGAEPELNFFESSVKSSLEALGYLVEAQVGSIGYLVDLAVRHPERPGYLVLGVECDGASWHSQPAARDRDRLRQAQLEDIGWRICRVWSTDWFRNPDREVARIDAEVQQAIRQGYGVMSIDERPQTS